MRRVTGGDATKAKQLTDLLYMRVHAGEQWRLNATEKEVVSNMRIHLRRESPSAASSYYANWAFF